MNIKDLETLSLENSGDAKKSDPKAESGASSASSSSADSEVDGEQSKDSSQESIRSDSMIQTPQFHHPHHRAAFQVGASRGFTFH